MSDEDLVDLYLSQMHGKKRKKRKPNPSGRSEHEEQVALFQWAALNVGRHPELERMFAIPNGMWTTPSVAHRAKAEGLKAGVPDICLPFGRRGYHSLYIEMKTEVGEVRPEQRDWIHALNEAGNLAVVCRGFDQAVATIEAYLEE